MHQAIWHALLHLGHYVGKKISKHNEETARSRNVCRRCSKTSTDIYVTRCCDIRLCETCARDWLRSSSRQCAICDKRR